MNHAEDVAASYSNFKGSNIGDLFDKRIVF